MSQARSGGALPALVQLRRSAGTGACAGASEALVWATATSTARVPSATGSLPLQQCRQRSAAGVGRIYRAGQTEGPEPCQSEAVVICTAARSTCPGSGMESVTAATALMRSGPARLHCGYMSRDRRFSSLSLPAGSLAQYSMSGAQKPAHAERVPPISKVDSLQTGPNTCREEGGLCGPSSSREREPARVLFAGGPGHRMPLCR